MSVCDLGFVETPIGVFLFLFLLPVLMVIIRLIIRFNYQQEEQRNDQELPNIDFPTRLFDLWESREMTVYRIKWLEDGTIRSESVVI